MLKLKTLLILFVTLSIYSGNANASPSSQVVKDRSYYEERGDIVWEIPSQKKTIAFTFDDGPDLKQTPQILEVLDQYQAKATFFVVGERVERFPEIVKLTLSKGHEVGNHSFRHPPFHNISKDKALTEIGKTQQAILQATGHTAVLFRPPGGSYNQNIINVSKQNNLQLILWSWHQDTKDWRAPGVQRIVNKVLKNVRNGDIILMHDYVYNSSQTSEALKIILPELKKQGYSFVTVSQLLSQKDDPNTHIKVTQ